MLARPAGSWPRNENVKSRKTSWREVRLAQAVNVLDTTS
jgi:hypothetical protein